MARLTCGEGDSLFLNLLLIIILVVIDLDQNSSAAEKTIFPDGASSALTAMPIVKSMPQKGTSYRRWVKRVDTAMSAIGPLYAQWPTFRCLGAIDALPKGDILVARRTLNWVAEIGIEA